ncbi:MAG: hypothetical protein NVSMB48_02640 [Marmoricola sp.]
MCGSAPSVAADLGDGAGEDDGFSDGASAEPGVLVLDRGPTVPQPASTPNAVSARNSRRVRRGSTALIPASVCWTAPKTKIPKEF